MPSSRRGRAVPTQRHQPGIVRQPVFRSHRGVRCVRHRAAIVDMGRAMIGCSFMHHDVRRCCAASASELAQVMRPHRRRTCTASAQLLRPTVHWMRRRTVAEALLRPHSDVQGARRQRAARVAPLLPFGQRCAPRARLAMGRSRERMREAKTEGQIKGAARRHPQSPSARGVGAARHLLMLVPRQCAMPHHGGIARVPLPILCPPLRWSARYGHA